MQKINRIYFGKVKEKRGYFPIFAAFIKKKIMRIDIITVLPEMLDGFINTSILARAQKKGLVEVYVHNLRDYTTDKHRRLEIFGFE